MSIHPSITAAAASNATQLDEAAFSGSDLSQSDLEAIAAIPTLESVRFIGGYFDTYKPLSRLPSLKTLAINHWSSDDLSSIGAITQLRELDLGENEQYDDIQFIAHLVNLEVLNLTDGQFSDLGPLSDLGKLKVLNLTNCDEVTDLSPLSRIVSLKELHLCSTGIDDISPLSQLSDLRFLDIRGTAVTDLAPLARLSLSKGLLLDDDKEYDNRPEPQDGG